jgi:hypothetical protein
MECVRKRIKLTKSDEKIKENGRQKDTLKP